ncbi:hypothetical protein DH2020_003702 [Rehmannia glutinosa]|uniref:RING-type domain-containing protein n=1 Tax=Rehmannia glutinosa TaxID=99300 RepID=A0ABR0XMS9_REHGL
MEMMYYQQLGRSSYKDSLRVLESDIQHANALAAAIPRAKGGDVYTDGRPKISTRGRKASIKDFYAVILPSLQQLHYDFVEQDGVSDENPVLNSSGKKRPESGYANLDSERDDECGICLEPCTKMVVPNCCHAMCINCYRDWSTRSESCPFCRGSLKRVKSRDLWVLTGKDDVIDPDKVSKEDLRRFYLYIRNLPKDSPDAMFLMYYEYLI